MTHTESKADGDGVFGDALRDRLHRLHSVNVPEENLPKPQEALRELLGSAASVYAGAKCTVQPYVKEPGQLAGPGLRAEADSGPS